MADSVEAALKAFADLLDDVVLGVDTDGRIAWVNAAARRRLDGSQGNPVGRPVGTIIPGLDDAASFPYQAEAGTRRVVVVPQEPAQGPLVRALAHDLNSVFSVVLTYSSLVLKSSEAGSTPPTDARWTAVRADVETIREAATEGAALCEKLTAAARRASGEARSRDEPIR